MLLSCSASIESSQNHVINCVASRGCPSAAAGALSTITLNSNQNNMPALISRLMNHIENQPLRLQQLSASIALFSGKIQRFGETAFAALFVVAMLQAMVALIQYRTNPSGELVVPPGLTCGIEKPSLESTNVDLQGKVDERADGPKSTSDVKLHSTVGKAKIRTSSSPASAVVTFLKKLLHVIRRRRRNVTVNGEALAEAERGINGGERRNKHTKHKKVSVTAAANESHKDRNHHHSHELREKTRIAVAKSKANFEKTISSCQNRYAQMIHRINKSLVLLAPWAGKSLLFVFQKYAHLFHLAFIVFTLRIFDFPRTPFLRHHHPTMMNTSSLPSNNNATLLQEKDQHIVVIGDSLAVGLGSVDLFDKSKNNSIPFYRIENTDGVGTTSPSNNNNNNQNYDVSDVVASTDLRAVLGGTSGMAGPVKSSITASTTAEEATVAASATISTTSMTLPSPLDKLRVSEGGHQDENYHHDTEEGLLDRRIGPVFPKVLARTLARCLKRNVSWRSAGVDGGDVPLIEKYCLGVIEEEVQKGTPPDIVVIICGINDLKYFIANPFKSAWPARTFRKSLSSFIAKIHSKAPNAKVIIPALPTTQMFHKGSPLNIFPLALFIDVFVGFWDSQKKLVADLYPKSDSVYYLGISAPEVLSWYKSSGTEERQLLDFSPSSLSWEQEDATTATEQFSTRDDAATTTKGNKMDGGHDNNSSLPTNKENEDTMKRTPKVTTTLLARDGVHPNARCYAHWAATLCDKIVSNVAIPRKA